MEKKHAQKKQSPKNHPAQAVEYGRMRGNGLMLVFPGLKDLKKFNQFVEACGAGAKRCEVKTSRGPGVACSLNNPLIGGALLKVFGVNKADVSKCPTIFMR